MWCLWRYFVSKGVAFNIPHGETLVWCSALATIMYTFKTHPDVAKGIPKSFLSFIMNFKDRKKPEASTLSSATASLSQFNQRWIIKQVLATAYASARAFGAGYLFQVALALIGLVFNPKLTVKKIVAVLMGGSHVRSGVFCGSMALLYWAVRNTLHFIRRVDDGWNCAAAGM